MAWNAGVFARIHDWSSDAAAGIDILASRMDEEDKNFADGISQCLNVAGQNSPTADIRLNEHKFLICGEAELTSQFATAGQVQRDAFNFAGASTGSGGVYSVDVIASPGVDAGDSWAAGFRVTFTANHGNDGEATLQVNNNLTNYPIVCAGRVLTGGEIITGEPTTVVWGGSAWFLQSPPSPKSVPGEVFTPIGVKAVLRDPKTEIDPSGIPTLIEWNAVEWDDAGFWAYEGTGDDATLFEIPDMPDTPDNKARFRIKMHAEWELVGQTADALWYATIHIKLGTENLFEAPAGRGQFRTVGIQCQPHVVAMLELELATGDQVKFGYGHINNGGGTEAFSLYGFDSPLIGTWCSITRMG